ncbi:polysaccharide deacetylase family protein [Pseudonocardia alni]|uniref:polysaccharide deacetylase family protein n=1 Tax=Pseudonocardia alni TaxID=33907 RepID=UPI00280C14E4|nr:polysaccharide deacetylase family protein [Pseudonocardia alni]
MRWGRVEPSAGTTRREVLRAAAAAALLAATGGCSTGPTASPSPSPVPGTPSAPPTTTPAPDPAGTEVAHAGTGRPELALTFHGAGEVDLARRVLTLLHDRGAAVTVLAVGTWLADSPDAARIVTGLGHEIGNHTWSHGDVDGLGEAAARVEIERCRDVIAAATGGPGAFFRPSQAQHATPLLRRLAADAGYPVTLSYDVDSRDFTDPGPAAVAARVRTAGPGSVVSMHLGHPGTLAALPAVLDDLDDRGLRAVTATRLLAPA